jgi:hypothetical protein
MHLKPALWVAQDLDFLIMDSSDRHMHVAAPLCYIPFSLCVWNLEAMASEVSS